MTLIISLDRLGIGTYNALPCIAGYKIPWLYLQEVRSIFEASILMVVITNDGGGSFEF